MALIKHPTIEGAWIVDYYPHGRKGKRVRQTIYGSNESQARRVEADLRRRRDGGIKNAANPTIRDTLPEWLHWMQLHRSPATVTSIGWALKHLDPHFGPLTVDQITEATINHYQSKRRKAPRACNLEIDYLKSLISWMVKRRLCNPLPFRPERLPYNEPIPRIPRPEDLQRWLDALKGDSHKRALVLLMLRCGLRFKEASHLRWEDVDLDAGVLYLSTTKGGRKRVAALPEEIAEAIKPAKKAKGWVWPSEKSDPENPKPYGSIRKTCGTASRLSGVEITPHTLRHICATYTLSATGDLRLVQATLGHTQIRTTQRYAHIDLDRIRAGQRAAAVYAGQPPPEKKDEKTDA